ncbi:mannose-6-phosphate isomerase [Tenacibaculum todarodis]|uniref:Phosphohexomutase n=1 Tax=Tenacibaculum todarodis TaxID=1850252 RepID=A0A1L3JMS2_9FLAO|nr:type I phosphomannose isomerase catalytic subunit [Tenacibaculum todarodis]APG66438.1 mannose-6-phosphate isomerase [Tenacibaculum todarodis]
MYPIKFTPILKEKIWGGNKLVHLFNKKSTKDKIGESWEVSGLESNVSVVENGVLKGTGLKSLIKKYKHKIVGKQVYDNFGAEFPLLFKFIDASENLSIQLHPNDNLAKERHNSFGKTEMWYVLDAEENAKLYVGFKKGVNKSFYLEAIKNNNVLDLINKENIKKGDSFFIESGTIHAIGKGSLIAEIQQTSDITYRVFDWNRVDLEGNERELHTSLAIDALDFSKDNTCNLKYLNTINSTENILSCKYFKTNKLNVKGVFLRSLKEIDSFVVYMCVEGEGEISLEGNKESIKKGETILIPAKAMDLEVVSNNLLSLLEVYIPKNNEV